MKVYLSAQLHRQSEMRKYREDLRMIGWDVVSSWIDEDPSDGLHAVECAYRDCMDMDQADGIILFTGPPYCASVDNILEGGRGGGRHVEFGMMRGLPSHPNGKVLIVVGEYENIFQEMPEVSQFPSWESFKNYITL